MPRAPIVPLVIIWFSLVLALCLQVMPLADGWQVYRPEWLGLMLIYWCMRTPDRVGVFHGFVLGILMDLIEGTVLGQHALIYALLAFLCALVYPRFRAYSLVQQSALVLVLLGLMQLVAQWLRTIVGDFSIHLAFLIPALISALLWPWLATMFPGIRTSVGRFMTATVLCLASASPRRRALLASIGVPVTVHPCDIDETPQVGESAQSYVQRLAVAKAEAAAPFTHLPILGSDTAVVVDGRILGKPANAEEGAEMLRLLSGRCHEVLTAVAVSGPEGMLSSCVTTQVTMREISADEIVAYWRTGEPADKAGGYAIQGLAAIFVKQIQGSHSAVVGLPLYETTHLLCRQGVPIWQRV